MNCVGALPDSSSNDANEPGAAADDRGESSLDVWPLNLDITQVRELFS